MPKKADSAWPNKMEVTFASKSFVQILNNTHFSIRYTEKSAVVDEEDPEDSGEILQISIILIQYK